MGAISFETIASGKTAEKAFSTAIEDAAWEHGHGGYTGTIAEKNRFVMINVPKGKNPFEYASELLDKDDPRVSDKWGPAGCIDLGKNKYLFFGYASY